MKNDEMIQLIRKIYMEEAIEESKEKDELYKDLDIIEIIKPYEKGMLLSDIVNKYGFPSKDILRNVIKKYYISKNIKEHIIYKELAYHDRDEIFSLSTNGMSMSKIAKIYNCSVNIISNAIKKYIDENNIKNYKQINIDEITEQLKSGLTIYQISKKMGISQYMIEKIVSSSKERLQINRT